MAEIALVGVAAIWGLTFPMVQDAVAIVPVFAFLAYRFVAAAAICAAAWHGPVRRLDGAGRRAAVVMGVFLTAGYVFQTFGLKYTSAAKAGFITGMFVVLTPVVGALVLRQRAGGPVWAAALVSVAGLYLLSGAGRDLDALGDGLVLLCALAFALHILATGAAAAAHDPRGLLVVQLAVCGLFCTAVAGARGELRVPSAPEVWAALAVTALFATALGFYVQTYAQRHAPPARTALILASEPAFAGLFAYLLKGETLSSLGWTGAAVILAAIVGVELVPYLRPPRPLPEG